METKTLTKRQTNALKRLGYEVEEMTLEQQQEAIKIELELLEESLDNEYMMSYDDYYD